MTSQPILKSILKQEDGSVGGSVKSKKQRRKKVRFQLRQSRKQKTTTKRKDHKVSIKKTTNK